MRKRFQRNTKVNSIPLKGNTSWIWLGLLLVLLAVSSFSLAGCSTAPAKDAVAPDTLPDEITVDEAYDLYQDGVFFLDVRTREEWNDFHAPNTTLIPLDELEARLNEIPEDEPIVVVCRSGNRSQVGRDILLNNGFEEATSMAGGLTTWRTAGYPIE